MVKVKRTKARFVQTEKEPTMLKRFAKYMPVSNTLTPHQLKVLDLLDSWLVENTDDYRGGIRLVSLEVPLWNQARSPERIVTDLTKGLQLTGYIPRSLAFFTLVDGAWMITIAERTETNPETDMEKLKMFYYIMNQTNSARELVTT